MVSPAIFPSRPFAISHSCKCSNLSLFGSREPQSQWFSLSGVWSSQAFSHVQPTILGFPLVWLTLNILQAEMPRGEWQKGFAIPSHEFVVKHSFIRAWNMWKQRKLLKVKVTYSVKKKEKSGQNIKVHGTRYHWAEGCREGSYMWRLEYVLPWVWKIPWRRKWQPTPVFLPGKSHGQRSLAGYSP